MQELSQPGGYSIFVNREQIEFKTMIMSSVYKFKQV